MNQDQPQRSDIPSPLGEPQNQVPLPKYPLGFSYDVSSAGVAANVQDPLTMEVARLLEQPPAPRTWLQSILLLGITLFLFIAAGIIGSSPLDLGLLVAVLLFHEAGHYLGMRLFNYQDVRMFFIPLFGAAVSGRSTSVEGYKEAIVLLLGPLPGIILGIVLGFLCLLYDNDLMRQASMMLLILNGFNLLPLLPLDGGRLMHLIVFSRQRHIEAVFRVTTALLLGLVAWGLGAWLLAIPAVLLLLGTAANFRIAGLAQRLRGQMPQPEKVNLAEKIPPNQALPLIQQVRQTFPAINQPSALTNLVRQLWERMHLRPPRFLASAALLAIYVASFFAPFVAVAVFRIPERVRVVSRGSAETTRMVEEVRIWGRVAQRTELSPDGYRHGQHEEFYELTGAIKTKGSFVNGERAGRWTYFDVNGKPTSFEDFGVTKSVADKADEHEK